MEKNETTERNISCILYANLTFGFPGRMLKKLKKNKIIFNNDLIFLYFSYFFWFWNEKNANKSHKLLGSDMGGPLYAELQNTYPCIREGLEMAYDN